MSELFPLVYQNDEIRLLTAIVLGFGFGFALERGGFGNARKLAGQFYLYDMTVFKVMFTAILVAMVGLYTLAGLGMVDMARMWINPTFMWGQAIGGFLLGVGFIMSGLCPGTSVVSAASGRWDGLVTLAGIFVGTGVWAVAVDAVPGLHWLYQAGSMGSSVLPAVFGVSTAWFVFGVVVAAGLAFIGAEKVEKMFQPKHTQIELTPRTRPRLKLALASALSLVVLAGMTAAAPGPRPAPKYVGELQPLALAEKLVAGDPNLLVLDLRPEADQAKGVPGAARVKPDSSALALLAAANAETRVVLYDAAGAPAELPAGWPTAPRYLKLSGGLKGWTEKVMTPAAPDYGSAQALAAAQRQNGLAAYFSGAKAASSSVAAPPPAMGGGAPKKKKAGGC